jgi:tetratricopeptide (TPR) repeat protein
MHRSLILLGLLIAAGCAPVGRSPEVARAVDDYYIGYYHTARGILEPLAQRTNEDYVLNNLRLGSVLLADYDLDAAEAAFFRAYEVINSTGVNRGGRDVAAAVVLEKIKVWKGEPFERAMANFYLGLVYYMRQDYPNARAAFENALFKLRDYGEGRDRDDQYAEVESNFIIAYLMLARAWQRLGEDEKAVDLFRRAGQLRPDLRDLADPILHEETNVLLVVDFGMGPRKVTQYDNSIVAFEPHPGVVGRIPLPRVLVNGEPAGIGAINLPPIDTLEMAQDRRWQSIDTIRLAKSIAGTGLMAAGAYQGLKRDPNHGAALGLLAAGALLKMSATADVRHWEMLPRTVFLLPLRLDPGQHDITVNFGRDARLSQTWRGIIAPSEGEATYYMRINRLNDRPLDWPPPNLRTVHGPAQIGAERISHSP